jgi:hypothetical protein
MERSAGGPDEGVFSMGESAGVAEEDWALFGSDSEDEDAADAVGESEGEASSSVRACARARVH